MMAVVVASLLSAAAAQAQTDRDKVDPRVRPLLDPAVVAQIDQAPTLQALRNIVGLPLVEPLALSRGPGPTPTMIPVFVSLTSPLPAVLTTVGADIRATMGSLFAARVPVAALATLAADPNVRYIRAAGRAKLTNDLAMTDIHADQVRTRSGNTFTGATGAGVIVGFVDTGIDWGHGDFKHPDGTTRILYIWDQTASGTPPGDVGGQTFGTGNECTAMQIDAGSCTEQDRDGHGSHVAGTAAGDGSATGNGQPAYQYAGVAPNADIIVVKTTFSFDDLLAGIEYIFKRAALLGKPAAVNLSLGTSYSSHDGTDPWEQAIDSLTGPGTLVVASAGNDGSNQNATGTQQALLLRHGTRTLASVGDTAQLTFTVPSYTPLSGNGNDYALFTMWYDSRDRLTITARRPDGTTLTANSGDPATASTGSGGYIYLDASTIQSAQNGDAQVELEVFDLDASQPPAAGTWRITVQLTQLGGSGRFDIWQYDESSTLGAVAFTAGGDNGYNVGSPGNAEGVVTVGAYTTRTSWNSVGGNGISFAVHSALGDLATFSSSGPTRPSSTQASRQKPDLTAPGTAIISTFSSNTTPAPDSRLVATDGVHLVSAGTSMSAPMVTGATALLLERNPSLTPEDVKSILTSTARQDAYTAVSWSGMGGGTPNPSWGYGKLDVQAALAATPTSLLVTAGPANGALGGKFVLPAAGIPSLQLRIQGSLTDAVRVTGLRLRSSGTGNDATGVDEVRVYADADSNGVVDPGETLIGSGTLAANDGEVVLTGLDVTVPTGAAIYLLGTYSLNGTPTNAQTFALSLESPANVTAERVSDMQPVSFAGLLVQGSAVTVQGIGTLTVTTGPHPPTQPLGIGTIPVLQFTVGASTVEDARIDSLSVTAQSSGIAAALVRSLLLYRDSTGNGAIPTAALIATIDNPFANGSTASFPSLGVPLAANKQKNFLVVVEISNRLRQGDSVGFALQTLHATGLASNRQDTVVMATPQSSALGLANLLKDGEVFLISENPVRSGRVIFTYASPPTSMALYNFAGVRVRSFTNLPSDRFEWDLRGESPGLPNGMYVLVVNVNGQLLRQRLMILSEAR